MLDVIAQLGECPMARIDAREWHKYFLRKVRRLNSKKWMGKNTLKINKQ